MIFGLIIAGRDKLASGSNNLLCVNECDLFVDCSTPLVAKPPNSIILRCFWFLAFSNMASIRIAHRQQIAMSASNNGQTRSKNWIDMHLPVASHLHETDCAKQ
jgi:hypothetical protein